MFAWVFLVPNGIPRSYHYTAARSICPSDIFGSVLLAVWAGYLRERTRHTVGEAASLKSKERYDVLHYSSKVHQSFQNQSNDSWGS